MTFEEKLEKWAYEYAPFEHTFVEEGAHWAREETLREVFEILESNEARLCGFESDPHHLVGAEKSDKILWQSARAWSGWLRERMGLAAGDGVE